MGRKEKGVKEKYQRDLKRETEREREWRRPTPLSQNQKLPATQTHTHRASQPNTQIHGTEILGETTPTAGERGRERACANERDGWHGRTWAKAKDWEL